MYSTTDSSFSLRDPAASNHSQQESHRPSQGTQNLLFHVFLFLEALLLSHRGEHRGGGSIVAHGQSLHIDAQLLETLSHVDLTPTHTNASGEAARLGHNLVSASCIVAMHTSNFTVVALT